MSERRLERILAPGPGAAGQAQQYPGQRLGLPAGGPTSVASVGRRFGALCIDWLLSMIISLAAFHSQIWTIAVFGVEVYLLTALTGFTVGKRLVGVRVARLDGTPVGLLWSLVRTVLLLAVVPPLVFDKDMRGLHDKAAHTIVIRI